MQKEEDFLETISSYSDADLFAIINSPGTYDEKAVIASENELEKRNLLPEEFIIRRNNLIFDEDERLSEGKPASSLQNFFGWLGIVAVLGIVIGYTLYYGKTKSIFTGKEYHTYNEESRENGRYMFYFSLILHAVFILYMGGWLRFK